MSILRSSQVDASRLDQELMTMLSEQFLKVFKVFQTVSGPLCRACACVTEVAAFCLSGLACALSATGYVP